jgi:organic radical activating enzyme
MTTEHTVQFYRSVKDRLNAVGPGMCLAKWYQVTLHLENGHNHSCHHPSTHQTPLHELENNPGALHNTVYKKMLRKQMLDGERPAECRYCWNIEDTVNNTDVFSDRVLKSASVEFPSVENTVSAGHLANPYPKHMEVSFSTTCNFACSYCSADVSSSWMKELKKYGSYKTEYPLITLEQIERGNKMPIPDKEPNPYIDAFWKWWPDVYPHLEVMRITGGEPLLSPHTFKVFDWVIANPRQDLRLAVNSNMCVPDLLIKRFINQVKSILESNSASEFVLFTSCEAYKEQAEYIRHGLDYQQWLENCDLFLAEIPTAKISLMVTYNAMSVASYLNYLIDITKLKKKFPGRVHIDTVYMANPRCMTIDILPKEFMIYIQQQLQYVKIMHSQGVYDDWELHKLERLQDYFQSRLESPSPQIDMLRRDFKVFVDEHDRRRGTNFLKTFPKMHDFYSLCTQS